MSHPQCKNPECKLPLLSTKERTAWALLGGLGVLVKPTYGSLKLLYGGGLANATEVLVFAALAPVVALAVSVYLVARLPITDRWPLILASFGSPGLAFAVVQYFSK